MQSILRLGRASTSLLITTLHRQSTPLIQIFPAVIPYQLSQTASYHASLAAFKRKSGSKVNERPVRTPSKKYKKRMARQLESVKVSRDFSAEAATKKAMERRIESGETLAEIKAIEEQ
jgi:hypothetical protein